MKTRLTSLNQIVLIPETDEEKLILASWQGRDIEFGTCINNAGMDHPQRFVTLTIYFKEKANND